MKTVESYKVISAFSGEDLGSYVQAEIEEGWQPYGSLCVITASDGSLRYTQAMVVYYSVDLSDFGL